MTDDVSERERYCKIECYSNKKYSPKETVGVIDKNALSMAVNQPKQHIFGKDLYPDVFSKAAVLLINLIKKHPFHNANKRTAFLAAYVFSQVKWLFIKKWKIRKLLNL
ncbi:death-on-curing protein [Enterococcus durans]|uniref:Death-on-curing protein n=1 Tax=Enterococcus durans TaxID=53345 RepID=A0A377JX98_9ENTE|nr:death-on-curing protein [Enterococcus durans]